VIELKKFSKRYGSRLAVDSLSLKVEKGEVFAFIGPNGAGKTTTIRFLATLLRANRGDALVCGYSVKTSPMQVKQRLGYVPDRFGLYDGMTVNEFLEFFAVAHGLERSKRRQVVPGVMELLDLMDKRYRLVDGLSRGMQQRLCLARALLHDPPVLVLDEPASGLDPRARVEMKELIKELKRMGKTIFISSHILTELADCCDSVGIIEAGKLILAGNMHDVLERAGGKGRVECDFHSGAEEAEKRLNSLPDCSSVERDEQRITFRFEGSREDLAALHRELAARAPGVGWFRESEQTLEDVVLSLTKGELA